MRIIKLLLLSSALALFGCVSTPETSQPGANTTQSDHWRARGKFSYQSNALSESGNFDWRQEGEDYQVRLYGPLGLGTVRISGNDNLVRIQTRDQDISSDQPLSLLYNMTGLKIPINSLPTWLNTKGENHSDQELTTSSGWTINYHDYQQLESGVRPMDISASQNDIRIRLIVKTWEQL